MAGPWDSFQPQQPASSAPASIPAGAGQGQPATFDDSAYAPAPASPAAASSASGPWSQFSGASPAPLSDYPAAPAPTQSHAAAEQPSGFLAQVDNVGRSLAQGATLGFGDELAAGADAVTHGLLGRGSDAGSLGDRYDANLATERARDASIPNAIAIPGQLVGAGAGIVAGAPSAVAKGALGVARMIPGANALLDVGAGAGEIAANALSRIPGAAYVAPVAKIAAEGAAYGGVQGFGDGEGGFDQRLQSAGVGAATGAALAPVVAGVGTVVGKGIKAAGNALSEAGFGGKAPVLDAAGKPIIGSDGQPVVATPGVARVAGQQVADATTDLPAAQNALANQPAPVLPGDQPTTFQVTGDYGQGQKELELRNTKGSGNTAGPSEAFLKRAADQNAVRVGAIQQTVPPEASSADLMNGLTKQQADLQAQQTAATEQAGQGTLQTVGGAADSTPTQAGADLRGSIDQARAPAIAQADAAVQRGQTQAAGASDALGGTVPAGTEGTAAQQFGQQFRGVLDGNAQDSKAAASRLYQAIDPDGTLAVNMAPAREAARSILGDLPQNAAPLAGEEAAIFGTMEHLPDAQSFRELGALNNRVTTAMRAARSDPAQAQSYARLSQLREGLSNIMQDSVVGQAGSDAAAVKAGTMSADDTASARVAEWARAWQSEQQANAAAPQVNTGTTGRDAGGGTGSISSARGGSGEARGRFGSASGAASLQGEPPLVANADQAAVDRISAANANYAEHKATFGVKAPGVGPVLAPGQTAGTFKMADSAVPSAIFSRGAGAAERVQAAVKAGLEPRDIANYAAFDLRAKAANADGTLDPAKFAKWRQANGEAFQALTQADPSIAGRFDTAQQASQRLADLQTQRTAIDATHPLKPGWGDAEIMQRVWQGGPKGADSVRAAIAGANGSPVAAKSIADYAAYSLRKAAAPNGVVDPAKYATWARSYDGALSARPEIKAQFDTAANAQQALNKAAEDHAVALRGFQTSVARHFLGGADPADRIGQILNSTTRQRDMGDLAKLTENDPAARAGIQRAIVDHIFNRLQSNALAGQTGIEKLKSDQFQTFIDRAGPALHDVMTPQQVDTLRKVALTLQRDNLSVDGTRVAGGSDTTQKAGLMITGAPGSTLMNMVRAHGLTGLLTIIGAKMGPVGAFFGNKAGAAIAGLKAAGIKQTGDLVKEAMLNPALARTLLADLTPSTEKDVANKALQQIVQLSAVRGAHMAVAVQHMVQPPARPAVRLNSLAALGSAMGPPQPNALSQ